MTLNTNVNGQEDPLRHKTLFNQPRMRISLKLESYSYLGVQR